MKQRKGPHPLSMHLGMAASAYAGMQDYASNIAAQYDHDDLIKMVEGIQKYQNCTYASDAPPLNRIWQRGHTSIMCGAKKAQENETVHAPLLIIPSLVNRSTIFNLNKRRSFVSWMSERSIPTYLIDWGGIYDESSSQNIEKIIHEIIPETIRFVSDRHGCKPNVLGYCIGGALSLGAAAHDPQSIGKIILLATPWDFHRQGMTLSERVRLWAPFALSSIEQKGYLPQQWLQSLFVSLDPSGSIKKFKAFAHMDMNSDDAKLFVDVEDWLNDNVSLPADIAQHCIQEWFAKNALAKNEWYIAGNHVDLSSIENDIMIVASDKDRLVPFHCAVPLEKTVHAARCTTLRASCGHIGFIAGKNAIEKIWMPMETWLKI